MPLVEFQLCPPGCSRARSVLGAGQARAAPVKKGPWVPCCFGAAASGSCGDHVGEGVEGPVIAQPLPASTSWTVCTAAAALAPDAWWLWCLGTLTWRHLQQVLVRAWDTECNPNHMGFPNNDPCHLCGVPGPGGYMFPLEVGSHYIRPDMHSTMPFPDIVTSLGTAGALLHT